MHVVRHYLKSQNFRIYLRSYIADHFFESDLERTFQYRPPPLGTEDDVVVQEKHACFFVSVWLAHLCVWLHKDFVVDWAQLLYLSPLFGSSLFLSLAGIKLNTSHFPDPTTFTVVLAKTCTQTTRQTDIEKAIRLIVNAVYTP